MQDDVLALTQVVPSLACLPVLEEVSPGCGGQAPLTPLTHLPLGAPVGTLVFSHPWVDWSLPPVLCGTTPCPVQVSVPSHGIQTPFFWP